MRDWIKMHTDLYRHPKVILMAEHLREHSEEALRNSARNVLRNAVVGALVTVWGTMRHSGKLQSGDLVCKGGSLQVIDCIADIPGFGAAMASVGWAIINSESMIFPRFFAQNNVATESGEKSPGAQRAARHREKKEKEIKALRDAHVTGDVTPRVEKSRVEIQNTNKDAGASVSDFPPEASAGDAAVIGLETQPRPVQIPPRMQGDDVMAAARKWFRHLRQAAPERVPQPGSEQLQEWWTHYGAIGPERFMAAVDFSIARGYKNLIEEKPEHERRDIRGPAVGSAASSAQRREANNAAAFAAVFGSHPNDWPKPGHVVRREADRVHGEPAGDMGGDSQLLPG
jgi:hypothetical protein